MVCTSSKWLLTDLNYFLELLHLAPWVDGNGEVNEKLVKIKTLVCFCFNNSQTNNFCRSELRGKPNKPDDKFDTNKIGFLFDIFLIAIAYISEVDAVIADPSKSILVYENKKIRSATLKTSIAKLLKKDTVHFCLIIKNKWNFSTKDHFL